MNPKRMQMLTLLLPIVSLAVSTLIVHHEYARGNRLKIDISRGEREVQRLSKLYPGMSPHSDHDDHDHHD